jgi:hypothetical protein
MEYKITFRNHFKSLEFLIYGSLLFAGLVYVLYKNEGYSTDLVQFFSVYYLVLLVPTLFIHIEYYLKNRNDILIIDTSEKTISINGQKPIFFSEIENITYVMPPVWHRKGFIRLLPFEDYHYAKIKMKNGEQFIFTCLMAYRVEDVLKQISGVPIEKRKLLFATTLIG